MTARRDLADRYLEQAVQLLPTARRDWGQAMRADLSTIDGRSARWRFALGCTGAALRQLAPTRLGWHPLFTVALILIVVIGEVAGSQAFGESVPLLIGLALLAWRANRPGLFGPVRPDRATRIVRVSGYVVVGLGVVFDVGSHRADLFGASEKQVPMFALLITAVAGLVLAITARSTTLGRTALLAATVAGGIGAVVAFLVLPFDRVALPLAAVLPGGGAWLAVVVFASPVVAGLVTQRRTGRVDQSVIAVLCAATVTAILTSVISLSAIAFFPGQIPDFVGPVMVSGTSEAARRAADATEAADPAAGLLAFGVLLGAVLWVMAVGPLRRAKLILALPLGALPVLFAASSTNFPGIQYILASTVFIVIATLAVLARSPELAPAPVTPPQVRPAR